MPSAPRIPVEILWCTRRTWRRDRHNAWSFPPQVAKRIQEECAGKSVLHPFGGFSEFGLRLDIDPIVCPDVVADAWLPPFGKDAFDVVVLDPPYVALNQQQKLQLLMTAAWMARERVIWFHTMWLDNAGPFMKLDRAWLVRVGRNCAIRCLEIFNVTDRKKEPPRYFRRGPQIRYNRWLAQPRGLALSEAVA